MKRAIVIVLALAAAICANAQATLSRKGIENPERWIQTTFAKGVLPPFSFTLDGVPSAKFIRSW
ncbi:MAG: hypothetical protein IIU16_00775, partial [Bacteroidales bacterium]|nr:hypothetical protein [Bacteroidales bacterium]